MRTFAASGNGWPTGRATVRACFAQAKLTSLPRRGWRTGPRLAPGGSSAGLRPRPQAKVPRGRS